MLREAAEREADEDAAASCGDRRLAARTLARVALLTTPTTAAPPTAAGALAVTGGSAVRRVQALLAPRPQSRPLLALTILALLVTTLLTTMEAAHDTEGLFEHAMHTAATPGSPPEW